MKFIKGNLGLEISLIFVVRIESDSPPIKHFSGFSTHYNPIDIDQVALVQFDRICSSNNSEWLDWKGNVKRTQLPADT